MKEDLKTNMPNKKRKGNTKYISGRKFEYKVRDYFLNKGALVIRSAGSKGIADIVAIPRIYTRSEYAPQSEYIYLIQCKHHGNMTKKQLNDYFLKQYNYNVIFLFASMEKRKLIFKRPLFNKGKIELEKVVI